MISLSVTSRSDFDSSEYAELFSASNATAFQHAGWLEPFYSILAPAHAVEPLIVVGRDNRSGELLLVLPLIRTEAAVDYAFLGVTDYACPIVRPEAMDRDLPEALRATIGDGSLTLSPVRQEHIADWRTLLRVSPKLLPFSAHSIVVTGEKRHFGARRRNDLTRKAGRLGELKLEIVHGDAIAKAFVEAQAFRRGRFENDPLQLDHGLAFYTEVATKGDLSGLSRTFRLSHEGRTVAVLFGLIDKGSFRYLILACDYDRYAEFSPGLIIFDRVFAWWAQAGGKIFDFTIGDEPYKAELGCASAPIFAFEA